MESAKTQAQSAMIEAIVPEVAEGVAKRIVIEPTPTPPPAPTKSGWLSRLLPGGKATPEPTPEPTRRGLLNWFGGE